MTCSILKGYLCALLLLFCLLACTLLRHHNIVATGQDACTCKRSYSYKIEVDKFEQLD